MIERDLKILQFITTVRVCTTEQVKKVLFKDVSKRICYRRLTSLVDSKLLKRSYYHINNKNVYVYYTDKKPSKRNLKHDLLITELYVRLMQNEYEVISFEKTPKIVDIVPDVIVSFKNNKVRKSIFVEIQLSQHDCIKKYFNIKRKIINKTKMKHIPDTLYIVTDNNDLQVQKLKDLNIIIDNINFDKLNIF